MSESENTPWVFGSQGHYEQCLRAHVSAIGHDRHLDAHVVANVNTIRNADVRSSVKIARLRALLAAYDVVRLDGEAR